jgi:pectate lyase-like protein
MKNILAMLAMMVAGVSVAQNPPPAGAFEYSGGSWLAAASTSTTSPLAFTPPPAALYCFNSVTNQWVPADSTCIGGSSTTGTVVASPQYEIPYYSAAGTSNTLTGSPTITAPASGGLDIGGAISGNKFTLTNLTTMPSSWTLDVTTPTTAINSLGALALAGGTMTGPIAGFEDQGGQVFSVTAYGALCNGSTDDSTAIAAAITAANANGSGVVLFPKGTCITGGGNLIYNNIAYKGGGRGVTTLKLKTGANTDVFTGSLNGYTATITNVALTSNVLTVTATNSFTRGVDVVPSFSGLTTATFLNGTSCQGSLTSVSGSTFTCPYTHANYSSAADTGTASVMTDYAAANHIGSSTGLHDFEISAMTVDGNAVNQTLPSFGIKVYGYHAVFNDLFIEDTYSDCMSSDFNATVTGEPSDTFNNVETAYCGQPSGGAITTTGAVGIRLSGPNDSKLTNVSTHQNASHGMMVGLNGGAAQITGLHTWGAHIGNRSAGVIFEGGQNQCINCESEGSDTAQIVALSGGDNVIIGRVFQPTGESQPSIGVQLGQAASSATYAGIASQATPGNPSPGATDGTSASSNSNVIQMRIYNPYASGSTSNTMGYYFANENLNTITGSMSMASGVYVNAAPGQSDYFFVNTQGLTCSAGSWTTCGGTKIVNGGSSTALEIANNSSADYLNLNLSATNLLQLLNGVGLQEYTGNYTGTAYSLSGSNGLNFNAQTTQTVPHQAMWQMNGALAQTPATAQSFGATGATILFTQSSVNSTVIPVSASSTNTGTIMTAGSTNGQQVTLINTGTNSITFAASSSNVSGGASNVIAAGGNLLCTWLSTPALWYCK